MKTHEDQRPLSRTTQQKKKDLVMEGLWQLLIVGCACHFLSSPGVFAVMIQGTPAECKRAQFVPGYDLAGEGLDIVTMQIKHSFVVDMKKWRKPDGSCNLVTNDYMHHVAQKLPLALEDWTYLPKCQMSVLSKKYESSEALVRESTSSVLNNWKMGLDLPNKAGVSYGGTQSSEATFAMGKSKEDKYSFVSHEVHCSLYRYRLASSIPLHQSFKRALNNLKKTYSHAAYQNLIDTYGTHYTTMVHLGGKMKDIAAIKSCQAAMKGLTDTAVKDCLDVEASAALVQDPSLKIEDRYCQKLRRKMGTHQKFSCMFRERHHEVKGGKNHSDLLFWGGPGTAEAYRNWQESLKTLPDMVSYSVKPLFYLMGKRHPARAGLKRAISDYITNHARQKKCAESCRIGRRKNKRDPCDCVCKSTAPIAANCCPTGQGLATLTVYKLHAKGLYGDMISKTDGLVQVNYGKQSKRTQVINNNDNPHWRETFYFGPIKIDSAKRLTFKVYDADLKWDSDLLGQCAFRLHQGNVTDVCAFQHGTFFFSYEVRCAPSLGGKHCQDYIPSSMSSSLAKMFLSRNGILTGQHWNGLLAGNNSEIVQHHSEFEVRMIE